MCQSSLDGGGGGVERPWVVDNSYFQCFRCRSSEPLEIRPILLHSDMQSLVVFLLIPKCDRDPYYQRQTRRLGTPIISGNIRLTRIIRGGSLVRRRQTTCVNTALLLRAHWHSLSVFAVWVCVTNTAAGSSYVGFGRDGRRFR